MPAVGDFLRKINPWNKGAAPPPPPPISTGTAILLIVLYALSYFVPFYLSPTTRPSPTLSRDAPSVIRARIRSVTLSSLLCTAATYVVLSCAGAGASEPITPREALHLLGLWPAALWDSCRVLFLTALLFLGPLFSYFIVERGWADWMKLAPIKEVWEEWTTWRNIIAGPVTEEILFRTASIPLMLLSHSPLRKTIFLTPIIFGLAHVHHFYEFRLTAPQVPASAALVRSLFQLGYTTVFGAYATFLFLRTGSLVAVCAVHAFCNCMGLPQVWGRVEPEPVPVMAGGDTGGGAAGGLAKGRGKGRPSILWTVAYYVLLVAGAVLWWRNLWVLSESGNALVPSSAFSRD
ncbi:hypothetical protein C8A03DRAFT_29186 [Achaetomium macrosporum]|uniref:intramembrane prenyl-peptidase Rce1 n=1 Tax=Achaetomium macrosporum TaxID=79813 RepID=A0AAN7CJU2_9PEZI|nr:hypothetical protein C8A03DRAFT_29186 [Achaetomium macrosporum]